MSDASTDASADASLERKRIRRALTIAGLAAAVGVMLTIGSAIAGASGRDGLLLLLLLAAAGAGLGGLHAAVYMLVDQLRGHHTTWRRLLLVVALMLAGLFLVAMTGGLDATG